MGRQELTEGPGAAQRSRRGVLAGAIGALTAMGARAITRVPGAQATPHVPSRAQSKATKGSGARQDGDPVLLGLDNQSTLTTIIDCAGENGITARTSAPGWAGVFGQGAFTGLDWGVYGTAHTYGVWGDADAYGVYGEAYGTFSYGVYGKADAANSSGVYGYAPAGSRGVYGQADVSTGWGVWGYSPAGGGVYGTSGAASGSGVLAENTAGGTALRVSGKAVFSRSGVATVAANSSQVTVTVGGITAQTLAFAQIRPHRPGVHIEAVSGSAGAGTITIYLNQVVTQATQVSWFVLG